MSRSKPSRSLEQRSAARTWEMLRRRPSTDSETYHRLADHFTRQGQVREAIQVCRLWIERCPLEGQAHFDLANLLFTRQRFDEAALEYRWLVQRLPEQAECWNRWGICAFRCHRYAEAAAAFQEALRLCPDTSELYERWAQALFHDNRLQEAEAAIRRAIQLQGDQASYHYCLAYILKEWNRVGEAMASLRHALALQPDYREARWHLCHLLLLCGRYQEAWDTDAWWLCELKSPPSSYDSIPLWDGMSFGGQTLLLRWFRGYGDNFQCWRYLPAVKALGGTIVVEAPTEVQGLLERHPDIDRILTPGTDSETSLSIDYQISALECPRIFNTTVEAVPNHEPPLRLPKVKTKAWTERCASQDYKVGIVWAGDPGHGNDHQRSCPLDLFLSLTELTGVTLYSLQKGTAAKDLKQHPAIVDLGADCDDFADTAAALHHMDLVISVDTAVLHLAGIMGKKACGLIPYAPDWRWHLEREDSPWYPTMRLFRQTKRGDWEGVLQRVTRELSVTVCR